MAGPADWMDLRHSTREKPCLRLAQHWHSHPILQMRRGLAGKEASRKKKSSLGQFCDQFPESGSEVRLASAWGLVMDTVSKV